MEIQLDSNDPLTIDIVESGVVSWEDLIRCVKTFHYGRNANRSEINQVWYERKGTCSSKHAFLKQVADLNQISNVQLILCVYKMDGENTPGIGRVLEENNLAYIPEAHCYIRFKEEELDVTTMTSSMDAIRDDLIEEHIIEPEQVINYKVDYHKEFIRKWGIEHHPSITFDQLWDIREKCIKALET